jgi:hypothetical protein
MSATTMDARAVKTAVARRYPARQTSNGFPMPGPYVVAEELFQVDVLAFGVTGKDAGKWIGHEVKVSRSDYRTELLHPGKRLGAVSECDRFYMVTPKGLLSADEKAYEEPEWEPEDFAREPCPNHCTRDRHRGERGYWSRNAVYEWLRCDACDQRGYVAKSRVEREAPTLWVPRDVGLIEVWKNGSRIVREPAFRMGWTPSPLDRRRISEMLRWVSLRPDPRHAGLVTQQRERSQRHRDAYREHEQARRQRLERIAAVRPVPVQEQETR